MQAKLLDGDRAREAIGILLNEYPNAHYYLDFKTPIDLLVAAILSAQTRDEVVNALTPALFRKYRTAKDYASADPGELYNHVKAVSFAGSKAKNIIATCKSIDERYNGEVPRSMEELVELPGVGRKTANTILINAYRIVVGIPVDTWVIKVPGRIGLTRSKDPQVIEEDLMRLVEKKHWHNIAYVFKAHGKRICQSQIPLCSKCPIAGLCQRNGVTKSG